MLSLHDEEEVGIKPSDIEVQELKHRLMNLSQVSLSPGTADDSEADMKRMLDARLNSLRTRKQYLDNVIEGQKRAIETLQTGLAVSLRRQQQKEKYSSSYIPKP
eukprot:TRINITY_DN32055_c0_g1_i1.p3 TRINITY_DN32055_c0_g1~~TRINITY_DN32055_c0_g1_i1.p3  ORF type:complete len:104 (+),score=12.59 TRINITY_DN32055_c0_g1_i1:785-1096(+)